MKTSRILLLFLALVAAVGAFLVASGPRAPGPAPVALAPPPPPATDDVLVAAKDIPLGTLIGDGAVSWLALPKEAVAPGMIRKSDNPKILDDIRGSIARAGLSQGDPVRREKLVKGTDPGLMAAILPTGRRAVAINIDSQGSTTAGGFILPNDHVDVIRTYREEPKGPSGTGGASGDTYISETLLQNVRVLAIGQNVQEKDGQTVVVGSNATLELDPVQSETVVLAQRTGQLSLALRSMLDSKLPNQSAPPSSKSMTVIRFGTATEDSNR